MKITKCVILSFLLSLFLCTTVLYAEEAKSSEPAGKDVKVVQAATAEAKAPAEEKVTGSASVAILNRYIFRGYEIGKSGLVIQPSLSASYKGFSVSYWGNVDTNQRNTVSSSFSDEGHKGFNETDLTLSYTYPIGKLSLTGGYIYYNLKYAQESEEFFVTLAYDIISKPTLTIYQDVTSYRGTYVNLSFGHSFNLVKDITLDLGASFGYESGQSNYWKTYDSATGDYTGSKYKGLHDGMVKAGFTIPVTKDFVIQPIAQYYFPLSGDASRTYGTDPETGLKISYNPNGYVTDNLVYGLNFAYSF